MNVQKSAQRLIPIAVLAFSLPGSTLLAASAAEQKAPAIWKGTLPSDYITKKDILYGEDPQQAVDVYYKPGMQGAPIVVYFHGGGWVEGDKALEKNSLAPVRYVAGLGCVVVSGNYRLAKAPDVNLYPTGPKDVACAVAWVQRNAEKYGGDRNKIIIGGHSAGAHLAALVAYGDDERHWLKGTPYEGDKLKIAGFIGWCGAYDWQFLRHPDQWQVKVFLGDRFGPDKWDETNPVNYPSSGEPPALLMSGIQDDVLLIPQMPQAMTKALTQAGVYCKLVIAEGMTHGDMVQRINERKELQAPVEEFINKIRKGEKFPPETTAMR